MGRVGAKDRLANTDYAVDDFVVVDDDKEYRCITAHTSDPADFNNDIANWKLRVDTDASASAIVDATNGLTESPEGTVKLGGSMTENTTIEFTGNEYELYFSSSPNNSRTTVDGWAFYTEDLGNGNRLIYTPEEMSFENNGFDYSFSNLIANTIEIESDDPAFIGLSYNADYSLNFTDRSLVDKAYVDNSKLKDVVTTSTTETVSVESDGYVEQTASGITTTLPAGQTGLMITVANRGGGSNTLDGNGAETIEGAATKTILDGEAFRMLYNGSTWRII